MKRSAALLFCLMLTGAMLAACSSGQGPSPSAAQNAASPSQSAPADSASTQIANPFTECATLEEAAQLAGFPLTVPDTLAQQYPICIIRVMKDDMIELIYRNDADEEVLRLRKAKGQEDISGDYNEYPETNTVTVGQRPVTQKGSGGAVSTTTWTEGEYAYAATSAAGMTSAEMVELIEGIH